MQLLRKQIYSFSVNKFNSSKDYYKILGISSTSNQKQIKKAFRQLAKKYHPDAKNGNQQKFKQVNQAYQVLSQADVKKQYDQSRSSSSNNSANSYGGNYNNANYGYGNTQSYGNNGYYYNQSSYSNNPYSSYQSNYRGYTRADGWQNQKYRQQVMNEIFKQYQKQMNNQKRQYESTYDQAQRNRANYGSFQDMYKNHQENIRQYTQQMKKRQQQIRKAQQAEQIRRQKQYRQFQQQQLRDFQKVLNKKVNDLKDGIVQNVHGFIKVGDFLKNTWKNVTNAMENLKKDNNDKNKDPNKKK